MGKIAQRSVWLAVVFCTVTLTLYLPSAHGFAILGFQDLSNPVRWSDANLEGGLTFAIGPRFLSRAPGDALTAVRNAFDTWSTGNDVLNFVESGPAFFGPFRGANIDIYSLPSYFFSRVFRVDGALSLAWVSAFQGRIFGVDIFFNEGYAFSDNPGPVEFDIESIALHEIGHAIGLDHPDLADDFGRNYDAVSLLPVAANPDAVLNSTIAPGEISRVLTFDDIAGRDFLYPLQQEFLLASTGIITAAAQHPTPTPEPGTLLLIGSGLVGIGVGGRRRKRK